LQKLRSEIPILRLTLRELTHIEIESALRKQEADIAIAILDRKLSLGIKSIKLIDIPLAITVPEDSPVKTFRDISSKASGGEILHPLISLPKIEPVTQLIQRGLTARNLRWEPSMEITELNLIQRYVAKGFRFGVAVDIPGDPFEKGIRRIKLLSDFSPLSIGALHTGNPKRVAQCLIDLADEQASVLKKKKGK